MSMTTQMCIVGYSPGERVLDCHFNIVVARVVGKCDAVSTVSRTSQTSQHQTQGEVTT